VLLEAQNDPLMSLWSLLGMSHFTGLKRLLTISANSLVIHYTNNDCVLDSDDVSPSDGKEGYS
jgi:hypothetical protein